MKFHLKKLLLSGFIIVIFVIYYFYERTGLGGQALSSGFPNGQNNGLGPISYHYKDGQFTGSPADAYYGIIQVKAVISDGKITDVQFLSYPNDQRTSVLINTQAMPMLKTEAIQAQNAQVNIISGATDTSSAFISSLSSALAQANS